MARRPPTNKPTKPKKPAKPEKPEKSEKPQKREPFDSGGAVLKKRRKRRTYT
jgi:hypothetical protein